MRRGAPSRAIANFLGFAGGRNCRFTFPPEAAKTWQPSRNLCLLRAPPEAGISGLNWAVATTAPNSEARAAIHLDRQEIVHYSPRFRDHTRRVRSLFPGYIFVQERSAWRPVLGTRGISGLITGSDGPALVIDNEIQDIRDREDEEGLVVLPDPYADGSRVRVSRGALTGAEGVCAGMLGQDRVFVLLKFMGQITRSKFRKADLVLA